MKIEGADYFAALDFTRADTLWEAFTPSGLRNSIDPTTPIDDAASSFSQIQVDASECTAAVRLALRSVAGGDPKDDEIHISPGEIKWFDVRGANVSTGYGVRTFSLALGAAGDVAHVYCELDRS